MCSMPKMEESGLSHLSLCSTKTQCAWSLACQCTKYRKWGYCTMTVNPGKQQLDIMEKMQPKELMEVGESLMRWGLWSTATAICLITNDSGQTASIIGKWKLSIASIIHTCEMTVVGQQWWTPAVVHCRCTHKHCIMHGCKLFVNACRDLNWATMPMAESWTTEGCRAKDTGCFAVVAWGIWWRTKVQQVQQRSVLVNGTIQHITAAKININSSQCRQRPAG